VELNTTIQVILRKIFMLKKIELVYWLLLLLFLLSTCKNNTSTSVNKKVFKYNQPSGISSLDPAFARDQANIWAVHQLYNGLVQFDKHLNIVPCIAKRWHISEDGLTYTFHLRNDVHFIDHEVFPHGKGRRVTAKDVAYSFSRIIDAKTASPGAWIFNGKVSEQNPFEAVDDTTFILRLQNAFRPMLSILSMEYTYVIAKEAVTKYGKDFRNNPVGTGAFKLKVWKEGSVMILVKNENYFEQDKEGKPLPYLDGVKISFIESKETQYLKFLQGEIDFMSGLDKSYINELLTSEGNLKPKHSGKIAMLKAPFLNTEYLGILSDENNELLKNHPLKNKLVRQSINYGFDRKEMIRYLRNNIGVAANAGFIPAGLPSFDSTKVKGYDYNPEKARRLLAEAGIKDGKGFPETILYMSAAYEDLGIYIQQQLKNLGLNFKLELVPGAFLREQMAKSKAVFFRGSWIADYPDAESYLAMFYSKNDAPPNYTRFSNKDFDILYEKAINENNDSLRYFLYQEMDRILIEEAPVVPLFYDEVVRFVRNDVKGMEPNAMNLLELKEVMIE
jgi:peptide/nickel transport system substrate-binding protein